MQKPDANVLAEAGGVTPAFARMVLAGTRQPSLAVALRIYDATGLKLGPLAKLDTPSIAVARKLAA